MSSPRAAVYAVITALVAACGGAAPSRPPVAATPDASIPPDASTPPAVDARDAVVATGCRPPAGVSGAPANIAETVALVNALPHPVTLTCLLESLDRPLRVDAVNSVISLQPARGRRSPRLFLASGKLILSVVPEGSGSALVEFGEFVDETRTVKGELEFPIEAPIEVVAAYRRLHGPRSSLCAGCHRGEEAADDLGYPEAFVSAAVRPVPRDRVPLEQVRAEHEACDASAEPQRCAFFRALFDHGPVVQWEFPEDLPTIFY